MKKLVQAIEHKGGRCYLIGGAVIDSIEGRPIKDWDIEVYNLSLAQIEEVLIDLGLKSDMVGANFGIIKTKVGDLDVDLNVPRRDNRVGTGHKGFECIFDPSMTPEEAGRRRDLTINSMYKDLWTGEIIDPWGGLSDLAAGIIRATDPNTFVEDPLRVLRIMQLLPRKGRVVDDETVCLCYGMRDEFNYLPAERIFEEFNKLLMLAEKPSIGLEFLYESSWIDHFPELLALKGCPQDPKHHPEGDVWNHTMGVIDAAAQLKHRVPQEWQLAYMYGALCHDFGKPETTKEDFTAYGHDMAGGPHAEVFMRRLTKDKKLIQRVRLITECHMRPGGNHRSGAKPNAWKRLHNKLRLDVAAMISRADGLSRFGEDILTAKHEPSELAMKYFEEFGPTNIPQVLQGRHLIDRGMVPGPEFGAIIKRAYEIQIEENLTDVEELFQRAKEE